MCSYRCDRPVKFGASVNEPFLTAASMVTRGTPGFGTTMTSRPFARVVRWMRFSSSARCACSRGAMSASRTAARVRRAMRGAIRPGRVFFTFDMSPVNSKELKALASELDTARVRFDEPLAPYTTLKTGGPADLFYEADSAEDLALAVLAARRSGISYFLLGLGANVLIGDRGFRGLVIRNKASHHE